MSRAKPRDGIVVLLRVLAATALMLAVAAVVFALSHGHAFFFPFVLLLGVPLLAIWPRNPTRK